MRLRFLLLFLLVCRFASAQDDAAVALTLFEEGQRLAEQKNYAEACPKFFASYKLAQKLGTLLNLAVCYENNGQLASAWVRFREAAALAERLNQPDRVEFAKEHATSLAPKLSTITITLKKKVPGMELSRDGSPISLEAVGVPIPIDPGEHTITAKAPDKHAWSTTVAVALTSTQTLEVPELLDAPKEVPIKPCELGDESCGRGFVKKRYFSQFYIGGGIYLGGFFPNENGVPAPYTGATTRVGGCLDIGMSMSYGLNGSYPNAKGVWHSLLIDPTASFCGGGLIGNPRAPPNTGTRGSGEFITRQGVTLGYQYISAGERDVLTGHQRGWGLVFGYRPALEFAFTEGYYKGGGLDFTHGPVLGFVLADHVAHQTTLTRAIFQIYAFHVPAKSGLMLALSAGASFP